MAAQAEAPRSKTMNTVLSLFSGGLAGAVSRTITSPLERLKVIQQIQATNVKYKGVVQSLVTMYKEEGLLSYWKGNGTNVVRIAPHSAIQFYSFDVFKTFLIPDGSPSTLLTLTAGGLAGATASTVCYPLDLARSYLTVQTTHKQYDGIFHCLRVVFQRDGFVGLYRGLPATLMGIAPYVAINFTVFDKLKRRFLPNRDHPWYNTINLLLGACSGGTAATITYPTDLIRRRIQLSGSSASSIKGVNLPAYTGVWDCVSSTVKHEGISGLYKGLTPCLLKVVPSMAIAFMIYEGCRKYLKFDPSGSKPPSSG